MSATLIKSVIVFIPAVMLLFGATLLFRKDRRASSLMQLLGAMSFSARHLRPYSRGSSVVSPPWVGARNIASVITSILPSATLGTTLFPLGYLLHARRHCPGVRT